MLECATRADVAVRRGNRDAWTYGFSFWDSVRIGATAQAEREAAARVVDQNGPDEMFAARGHLPIAERVRPQTDRIAGYDVRFNTLGLRGDEVSADMPRDGKRIVVLGGSFVFGWGLPDDDIWTKRLERLLRTRVGPTEIVNAGRNGGTINWALMTLLRLSRRLPFDEVLLLSTYNNRTLVAIDGRPTWAAIAEYYLYNSSLLYVVLEEKISQLRHQALDYQHLRSAVRVSPDALDAWLSLYRRRLAQIAVVCREHGSALLVGGEPQRFYDVALDRLPPGHVDETRRLMNRVTGGQTLARSELDWLLQSLQIQELRAVASRGEAIFIDTASAFMPDKAPWMMDEIHSNRSGSEKFAVLVANAIAR